MLKSTCRKLWCLTTCQISTLSLISFLRYYKDIVNLLFKELWECLTIPIKIILSVCSKLSYLSAGKNSASSFTFSISNFFLQRYCKLFLGTIDMPSYTHPKWYYQFVENFHVYLQAKNQLHPPCFSEDWLSAFWPINREQEFCQIWDWWWNINNISFHFRSFPRKTF